MDALSRSFLPATSRNEPYFLDPRSQQMTAVSRRVSRRDGPEAKNPGKIISQRPTRDRVSQFRRSSRDCFPHLLEKSFSARACFGDDE